MRLLWLTYERPPHPDAVCYPASQDDVEFTMDLLQRPYAERINLTGQLARYLTEQDRLPALERSSVACRTPGGIYRCVPWRLAKWLRHVLPAADSVLRQTVSQMDAWRQVSSSSFQLPCSATGFSGAQPLAQ